jgi:predicted TIM-barrel fold metal-dependent hydrolase
MAVFIRPSAPGFAVPEGACDCHMHIFGPSASYPFAERRSYTPPPALIEDYRAMASTLGLSRVVVVQPSAYGMDNRCTLDALDSLGERARGVLVLGGGETKDGLARMHARGARGVRLNTVSTDVLSPEGIRSVLDATVRRIAPLGWHVQVYARGTMIEALGPLVQDLPVDVVFDHMGRPDVARGLDQPGFRTLLDLLGRGRCWVKLSGLYRVSADGPGYEEVEPFVGALVEANLERLLWGSDWPHTGKHPESALEQAPFVEYRPIDDGLHLARFAAWAGEAAMRRILVDNPAALYGFA